MTAIKVQALQVRLAGLVAADATVQLQCWAGDAPAVRMTGADVIFPPIETVQLRAGIPAPAINYPPTLGACCVKITIRSLGFLLERYVAIPETGPVDFDDLVDVDPGTFAPTLTTMTAWQAWRDAAELLATTASQGAATATEAAAAASTDRQAASTAATDAATSSAAAATSASNAGTFAAAALLSEQSAAASGTAAQLALDGSVVARAGAESARDLALAGQFAGAAIGTGSLDAILVPGVYWQSQTAPATPANGYPTDGATGYLDVWRIANGSAVKQRWTPHSSSQTTSGQRFYERVASGGTWGPWRLFAAMTISEAAGRTITTWDALNGRPQLIYGDTGWREISVVNGWTTGYLRIRRVGQTVFFSMADLDSTSQTATTFATVPSGFCPNNTELLLATIITTPATIYRGYISAGGSFSMGTPIPAQKLYITASWATSQAWPANLPGTAVGGIPNT